MVNQEYELLVNKLIQGGYLKTPEIIEAFLKVDRVFFVPEELKESAYEDRPLPINDGQSISQPLVVAFILEHLSPKKGDRVLDIGTGSGWVAAILAEIVGSTGKVITIERLSEVYKKAKENISKIEDINDGRLQAILGDATSVVGNEIFDKIVSGAQGEEIPKLWQDALAIHGRMVVPVKGSILVADKISTNKFESQEYFGFNFTPLISDKKTNDSPRGK